MPTVVVFDCESDGKPTRIGQRGEQDFRHVQCTVACAMVLDTSRILLPEAARTTLVQAREITCWRDVVPCKGASPFKNLLEAFDQADVIVGYNSLDFDLPLLWKYYGAKGSRRYMEHRLKSLDIFSRLRAVSNQWPKLEQLLESNQLGSKSGDGAHAITLWEQNKRDELRKYCMQDVRLTAQLALLPRLRMGNLWIPAHVYGVGPAVHAMRVSEIASTTRYECDSPTPTEAPDTEEVFVIVPHPDIAVAGLPDLV